MITGSNNQFRNYDFWPIRLFFDKKTNKNYYSLVKHWSETRFVNIQIRRFKIGGWIQWTIFFSYHPFFRLQAKHCSLPVIQLLLFSLIPIHLSLHLSKLHNVFFPWQFGPVPVFHPSSFPPDTEMDWQRANQIKRQQMGLCRLIILRKSLFFNISSKNWTKILHDSTTAL